MTRDVTSSLLGWLTRLFREMRTRTFVRESMKNVRMKSSRIWHRLDLWITVWMRRALLDENGDIWTVDEYGTKQYAVEYMMPYI